MKPIVRAFKIPSRAATALMTFHPLLPPEEALASVIEVSGDWAAEEANGVVDVKLSRVQALVDEGYRLGCQQAKSETLLAAQKAGAQLLEIGLQVGAANAATAAPAPPSKDILGAVGASLVWQELDCDSEEAQFGELLLTILEKHSYDGKRRWDAHLQFSPVIEDCPRDSVMIARSTFPAATREKAKYLALRLLTAQVAASHALPVIPATRADLEALDVDSDLMDLLCYELGFGRDLHVRLSESERAEFEVVETTGSPGPWKTSLQIVGDRYVSVPFVRVRLSKNESL